MRLSHEIRAAVIIIAMLGALPKVNAQPGMFDSIPVIESFLITDTVPVKPSEWDMPSNSSIMSGHNNYRRIGSESYIVFLNTTLDSVIIINWTREEVTGFPIPILQGSTVELLYFHNPDSVFLFFSREFIHLTRQQGKNFSDFILCNSYGEVINEYSLDEVPCIYNGQINPMVHLRSLRVTTNLIRNSCLYLPFNIYLPKITDTIHKKHKISMLCEFNLSDKKVRMLNITLPDELIGKDFKSDYADGMMLEFQILNDTTLMYYFRNYGSIYKYHLNQGVSEEVYSADQFPFRNNLAEDPDPPVWIDFADIQSSSEDIFQRWVTVEDYKHYKPFRILQLFNWQFNLLGCLLYDGKGFFWLNDPGYGTLYINKDSRYSVNLKDSGKIYLHVEPNPPIMRSVGYIEQNLLIEKIEPKVDEQLVAVPYKDRILMYLSDLNIPDSTKVIVIGFASPCPHVFDHLLSACRNESMAFYSQRIRYLFPDSDRSYVDELARGHKIPLEWMVVDDEQIFRKYLYKEEYGNNPLIHYYNRRDGIVVQYNLQNLMELFRKFLEE